jgi:hypothetical protein
MPESHPKEPLEFQTRETEWYAIILVLVGSGLVAFLLLAPFILPGISLFITWILAILFFALFATIYRWPWAHYETKVVIFNGLVRIYKRWAPSMPWALEWERLYLDFRKVKLIIWEGLTVEENSEEIWLDRGWRTIRIFERNKMEGGCMYDLALRVAGEIGVPFSKETIPLPDE